MWKMLFLRELWSHHDPRPWKNYNHFFEVLFLYLENRVANMCWTHCWIVKQKETRMGSRSLSFSLGSFLSVVGPWKSHSLLWTPVSSSITWPFYTKWSLHPSQFCYLRFEHFIIWKQLQRRKEVWISIQVKELGVPMPSWCCVRPCVR